MSAAERSQRYISHPKRAAESNLSENSPSADMVGLLRSTVSAANYGAGAAVRAKLQSCIFKKKRGGSDHPRERRGGNLCGSHVTEPEHFRRKVMAQREASRLPIRAQPLTSLHMLNQLLKAELTARGGIKRCPSCICPC